MLWVRMVPSGKNNPLDPEPREDGKLIVDDPEAPRPRARFLKPGEQHRGPRYVSHFATCPNRKEHRKGRGAE